MAYSKGSVSLNTGGNTLSGVGTTWVSDGIISGDLVYVELAGEGRFYLVSSVQDETTIVVTAVDGGAAFFPSSHTGIAYGIVQMMHGATVPSIAASLAELQRKWHRREREMSEWFVSTEAAYPVTSIDGRVVQVPTPLEIGRLHGLAQQAGSDMSAIEARITAAEANLGTVEPRLDDFDTKYPDAVSKHADVTAKHADVSTKHADVGTKHAEVLASAGNAATSEANALASKNAAATSEANALASKNAAATSEANAAASEASASASKNAAATSEANAATSEANALASKNAAATSEVNALASENAAAISESNALASKNAAAASKTDAEYWAQQAQSIVTGGMTYIGGYDASSNAFPPSAETGYMYRISVAGTLSPFSDDSMINVDVGDYIIKRADGMWDFIDGVETQNLATKGEVTALNDALNAHSHTPQEISALAEGDVDTFLAGAGTTVSVAGAKVATVIIVDNRGTLELGAPVLGRTVSAEIHAAGEGVIFTTTAEIKGNGAALQKPVSCSARAKVTMTADGTAWVSHIQKIN